MANNYTQKHRKELNKYRFENGVAYVDLFGRGEAVLDVENYGLVKDIRWVLINGYACTNRSRKYGRVFMHNLIMNSTEKRTIDHISGNKLDNRLCNLRKCTHAENMKNKPKINKETSSIYKGVSVDKRSGNFLAKYSKDLKSIHIGCYKSEIAAAYAYNVAVLKESEFYALNDLSFYTGDLNALLENSRSEKHESVKQSGIKNLIWNKGRNRWNFTTYCQKDITWFRVREIEDAEFLITVLEKQIDFYG